MSTMARPPEAQAAFDNSTFAHTEVRYQRENACRLLRHATACLTLGGRVFAGRSAPSPETSAILEDLAKDTAEIEAIARRLEGA